MLLVKPQRQAGDIREGDVCIHIDRKVIVDKTFSITYAVRLIGKSPENIFAYRFVKPKELQLDPDSYIITES